MAKAKEIKAKEAARRLGLRMDSLYPLLWAGKLPARKENGEWLVERAAVERRARERERIREAAQARNAQRTTEGVHA